MVSAQTVERFRSGVVLLAVATTVFFVYPPAYDQFIVPKYFWVKVVTGLLAALAVVALALGADIRVRLHRLNLVLLLFVGWKGLSWFWADSRPLAGDEIRWWAVLLVWCLLLQDWLRDDRRRLMRCAWALTLSALGLSLWVLFQDFTVPFWTNRHTYVAWSNALIQMPAPIGEPLGWLIEHLTGGTPRLPDWRGWLWAGLGNTNHIADYLALLLPMIVVQYVTARGKLRELLTLGTLVVSAAALIACWSVGSNAGLIIAAITLGGLLVAREGPEFWRRRALRLAVLVGLWTCVVAFYVVDHPLNPHPGGIFRQAFGSQRWQAGWPTRVAIWARSVEMIREHPLVGIGAGNFTYGYTAAPSPYALSRSDLAGYAGMFTNAAHNEALQAWVETGAVGLLLLLLLWIFFFTGLVRGLRDETDDGQWRVRAALIAMMVAFVCHSLMNFTLQIPVSSLLFVGMIAVAAAVRRDRDEFPLTVRQRFSGFELDIETTGMRRIQSIGFQLKIGPAMRALVIVVTAALGMLLIGGGLRPLIAEAHFKQAKTALQAAERLEPDLAALPPSERLQALARRRPGALAEAEKSANRAIKIDPGHYHARKMVGRICLATGRSAQAREELEKVRSYETVYDYFNELGEACWRLGDREAAGENWAIYFRRRPLMRATDAKLWTRFKHDFPDKAAELER